MDVNTAVNQLIKALADTREYQSLRAIKSEVARDTRASQMLVQFEKKKQTLYTSKLSQSQAQTLMNELDSEYEKLSGIPEVRQYFTAVENFGALMDNVFKAINEKLAV